MEIQTYKWWGESGEPPAHLKTKKQLAEIGLKPLKAVGVIKTRKYDLLLYDPTNPESVKPKRKVSDKQKESLEKGRKAQRYKAWYRQEGWMYEEYNDAIKWAKSVVGNDDFVILDTETTGLFDAEVVSIGIINMSGEVVIDSLIRPTIPIPADATDIHSITNEMVVDAPSFPEIFPQIQRALESKQVIIYNAEFDRKILNYCCKLHGLKNLGIQKRSHCAMEWYAQFVGDWSPYYRSYKWQPLNGGHSAISDCMACLDLIKKMSSKEIKNLEVYFDQG